MHLKSNSLKRNSTNSSPVVSNPVVSKELFFAVKLLRKTRSSMNILKRPLLSVVNDHVVDYPIQARGARPGYSRRCAAGPESGKICWMRRAVAVLFGEIL